MVEKYLSVGNHGLIFSGLNHKDRDFWTEIFCNKIMVLM